MKKTGYPLLMIICAGLCACSSPQRTAPISDRSTITSSSYEAPIDRNTVRYTVKSGDTLSQISRRSGHSVAELAAWNQISDLNDLKVGQVIWVQAPTGETSGVQTASVGTSSQVEVRSIDSGSKGSQTAPASSAKSTTQTTAAASVSGGVKEVDGINWSWPANGNIIASFAAGKNSALKIEGFATDYTGLKLEYEITANGAGNQNIIKVLTDKGDVDVPDMPIVEQNKYQSVTLAIPDGASYIQFTSEESTNTSGYRIDNVSLTGIAK